MILFIKALLVLTVFSGFSFFLHVRLKIQPALIPVTTVALITICLYFFGLCGALLYGVILITGVGLASFAYYSFRTFKGTCSLKDLIHPGTLFFLGVCGVFLVLLHGVEFSHYDNFSHWALIVKEMCHFNAFPDPSSVVTFRSYPPGTATFIFYICKIVGYSEPHALMAQGVMVASALSTLFFNVHAIPRGRRRGIYIGTVSVLAVYALCIVSYDNGTLNIYNLLIDELLGLLSAASLIVAYHYRHDFKRNLIVNAPLLTLMILTKGNGKLFFCCTMLLLFILLIAHLRSLKGQPKRKEKRRDVCCFILVLLIPLVASMLWSIHIKNTYPDIAYEDNQYTLSLSMFKETFESRPIEFLQDLPEQLLHRLLDLSTINTQLLVGVNIIALVLLVFLIATKRKKGLLVAGLVFSNAMILLYAAALYILYAMMMPLFEAVSLAAFDRYYGTAIVVFFIILSLCILNTLFTCEKTTGAVSAPKIALVIFPLALIIYSGIVLAPNMGRLVSPHVDYERRKDIMIACREARVHMGRLENVLIYNSTADNEGYLYYVSRFELETTSIEMVDQSEIEMGRLAVLELLERNDYLILVEDIEMFWSILNGYGIYSENGQDAITYEIITDETGELNIRACE